MTFLSLSAMHKIFKKAGAERISEDAKEKLREIVEDYALEIARRAVALAKHAKRNTVMEDDVKLAVRG